MSYIVYSCHYKVVYVAVFFFLTLNRAQITFESLGLVHFKLVNILFPTCISGRGQHDRFL